MKKKMMMLLVMGMMLGNGMTAYATPARMEDGTLFDSDYYAETNPDLMAAFGRNTKMLYQHYVNYGKAEGQGSVILPICISRTACAGRRRIYD